MNLSQNIASTMHMADASTRELSDVSSLKKEDAKMDTDVNINI